MAGCYYMNNPSALECTYGSLIPGGPGTQKEATSSSCRSHCRGYFPSNHPGFTERRRASADDHPRSATRRRVGGHHVPVLSTQTIAAVRGAAAALEHRGRDGRGG